MTFPIHHFSNGASYRGGWRVGDPGHPFGWGVHVEPDGTEHAGWFEINARHGRGVQFFADGRRDDNERIYWENGELISQSAWFAREQHGQIAAGVQRLGIPFTDDGLLSLQEKILLLYRLAPDWLFEIPDMFGLVGLSMVAMFKEPISQYASLVGVEMEELLYRSSEQLEEFFVQQAMPTANQVRLRAWHAWCRSEERQRVEVYLCSTLPADWAAIRDARDAAADDEARVP